MSFPTQVLGWFSDPAHWLGSDGVFTRVLEHLYYSGLAVLVAIVIAVPVGALIGHTGRGGLAVVGSANALRSLPDLGMLTLLVLLIGLGLVPVVVALMVLAVPPLLAGSYAGVSNVDRAVVDAARGVGMREHEVLLKVELPNALPLLIGGLRSAALQVVATAAVAAYIGSGGLGRFLIDGQRNHDYVQMAAGAVLVAVLALAVEGVLAGLQRVVVSPGVRAEGRRDRPTSRANTASRAPAADTTTAGVNR